MSFKLGSFLSLVLLIMIMTSGVVKAEERTVLGKIKSGFQLAGKLLGIDEANGVAQLVTQAFGKTRKKGDDAGEGPKNIFSGFLRILGFDSKKIGAIAVNAIIFIAQLISSSLSVTSPSQLTEARNVRAGSPLDWLMESSEVMGLISHAQDKDLPIHIVNYIKERSMDEETDCVQLLVCKSSPFVWGMQKALGHQENSTVKGPKALYQYLPTVDEVADNGDRCDKRHPYCFVDI